MRKIIISSERHPIPEGIMEGQENEKCVLFFGLHKNRGDDYITSTRVTDKLYDVMREHKLRILDPKENKIQLPHIHQLKMYLATRGIQLDCIGISRNVRDTYNPEEYKTLLRGLSDALDFTVKPTTTEQENNNERNQANP